MILDLEQLIAKINPMKNGTGKSPIGMAFGAGTQMGFSIGELRDFIKLQKRCKGYDIQTTVNTTTYEKLVISGNAKILLGFNLSTKIADIANLSSHSATLTVNNETIFENINLQFLNPNYNWKEQEYFPFPRPLSGSDDVTLAIKSGASADLVFVELYYI